jgi:hypothetical protein
MIIAGGSIMACTFIFPMQEGTVNTSDLLPLLDGSEVLFEQQPTEVLWVPLLLPACTTMESAHNMASIISLNFNAISILFLYY